MELHTLRLIMEVNNNNGVPQGFVLGPIHLTLYMLHVYVLHVCILHVTVCNGSLCGGRKRTQMQTLGMKLYSILYNITQVHPVLAQAITLLLFGYDFGNYVQLSWYFDIVTGHFHLTTLLPPFSPSCNRTCRQHIILIQFAFKLSCKIHTRAKEMLIPRQNPPKKHRN